MRISFKNIFHFNKKNKGIKIENRRTGKKVTIKKVYDSKNDSNTRTRAGRDKKKILINEMNFLKNKKKLSRGYYVLFFAMIALSVISVRLSIKTYNVANDENYLAFDLNEDGKKNELEQSEAVSTVSNIDNGNKNGNSVNNVDNTVKKEENKIKTDEKKKETVKPLSFSKPLSGDILKIYSADKVIYSKTLELWKTHDGIDIKANIGESVKSIEKGVIEKIYDDAFYGKTIVIDHGQGYKSSYSNLDENVYVNVNQSVIKGKVIGKVGSTSIGEIKDDPHLHFMLFKDSNVTDPTSIFK